jgi:hypothetical protein
MPVRKKLAGRSKLAQSAQFRTSAGAVGGSRKLQARRRRRKDRQEEQEARREGPVGP